MKIVFKIKRKIKSIKNIVFIKMGEISLIHVDIKLDTIY